MRIAALPDNVDESFKKFLRRLLYGWHAGLDVNIFLSKEHALGLSTSYFNTKSSIENVMLYDLN